VVVTSIFAVIQTQLSKKFAMNTGNTIEIRKDEILVQNRITGALMNSVLRRYNYIGSQDISLGA